ncbi:hypothetical protein NDU88_002371 [Pleurodeles waltl]|uniref:Uncharacterized protein n=1 Tax=Pleurodeles waltl TaxID=8319 RepID=A0AAV7UY85_PLEWA|nr:hypothetical protein NDU88_002371 [Pleurodeles waltl]
MPATEEPGPPTASASEDHFTYRPPYAATPGEITGAAFPEFSGGRTRKSYKSCRNVSMVSPWPTRNGPAILHHHHGARSKTHSPEPAPSVPQPRQQERGGGRWGAGAGNPQAGPQRRLGRRVRRGGDHDHPAPPGRVSFSGNISALLTPHNESSRLRRALPGRAQGPATPAATTHPQGRAPAPPRGRVVQPRAFSKAPPHRCAVAVSVGPFPAQAAFRQRSVISFFFLVLLRPGTSVSIAAGFCGHGRKAAPPLSTHGPGEGPAPSAEADRPS